MGCASSYYESSDALAQYLWLHYADRADAVLLGGLGADMLEFPQRCIAELVGDALPGGARALDVGCAVGRATFELARRCEEVIGIDRALPLIEAAQKLCARETILYAMPIEGELHQPFAARAPEGVDLTRIRFEVGNAAELRADLGVFDVVFAANLICRMMEPKSFSPGHPVWSSRAGALR